MAKRAREDTCIATIDTHHHIYPPKYFAEEPDLIAAAAPGFKARLAAWTPQEALDIMDHNGSRPPPAGAAEKSE
jgi:hypothetical protein